MDRTWNPAENPTLKPTQTEILGVFNKNLCVFWLKYKSLSHINTAFISNLNPRWPILRSPLWRLISSKSFFTISSLSSSLSFFFVRTFNIHKVCMYIYVVFILFLSKHFFTFYFRIFIFILFLPLFSLYIQPKNKILFNFFVSFY